MIKMIEELINAAKREDWDFVDKQIPKAVKDPKYVAWAYDIGIHAEDNNVRDLGVSILEKARIPPDKFAKMKPDILNLMNSDPYKYVRFRSAFTLVAHGQGNEPGVKQVLLEAKKDPNTEDIAKDYLKMII